MVKRKDLYRYSKLFPVISNLIYFVLACYITVKTICLNKCGIETSPTLGLITTALVILILLICLSGGFSIYYHMNTPAYHAEPQYENTRNYKESLSLDSGFALTSSLISLLIILIYSVYYRTGDMFLNTNFYTLLVFVILSIISYVGAGIFWKVSYTECKLDGEVENGPNKIGKQCFQDYQNLYNMYHTSWHLFIGFAGFFWAILFFDLITPRLKNTGK